MRDIQKSLQLTGGNAKKDRRELDFYPTPEDVTIALMEFLKDKCSFSSVFTNVWEPAAGDGAMSKVLERYFLSVLSTDIRHTGFGIGGIDFLEHEPIIKFDAIITNPPFNLSTAFIERAVKLSPVVAMLLKSQYWHAKTRSHLFFKNPPAWVLPLTWRPDFLNGEKGGAPTMECIWTVWLKGSAVTKYMPLLKPL